MMRDARINQIGEGANDVLKAFIALVGMRGVGEQLKGVLDAISHPLKERDLLWRFLREQVGTRLTTPEVPVQSSRLQSEARALGRRVRDFGLAVQQVLRQYRESVLERQYVLERISDAACELYASSCTLSRLDHWLTRGPSGLSDQDPDLMAGRYFLKLADRRIRQSLAALNDNDDALTTATANVFLEKLG
jgi:alkylation response protein AidB-like acyl-CoA dehydrogenase